MTNELVDNAKSYKRYATINNEKKITQNDIGKMAIKQIYCSILRNYILCLQHEKFESGEVT